ncbi:MAG: DUF6602 domain-containing protein [Roseiarcus sp.]
MSSQFDPIDFVNRAAKRLVFEFDDAGQSGSPGLIGAAKEHPARQQFRRLLPSVTGVGSGLVFDSYGGQSLQQDVVLYEHGLCPIFCVNETPEATYYPCEGVIAVGEVKSSLNSQTLADAFGKIGSVKRLRRRAEASDHGLGFGKVVSPRSYGTLPEMAGTKNSEFDQLSKSTDQIFGFILCGSIDLKPETILDRAATLWRSVPKPEAPNIIISLNDGFLRPLHEASNSLVISIHEATAIAFSTDTSRGFTTLLQLLHDRTIKGRTVSVSAFMRYFAPQNPKVSIAGVRQL